MCGLSSAQFAAAIIAIDTANAADPTSIDVRGSSHPLALVHGQLAAEWVARLHPDADEAWLLAARAHHLRRWEVPRTNYAPGRAGYLKWKRDQRVRHAADVGSLLVEVEYGSAEIERVQALVRRDHLATDPGSQAVEDAACLVFIETQLADVSTKLEHDHLIDVIRKTAKKMAPAALAAVSTIPLGEVEQSLLASALAN
ncbi:MAG: DUF4202 domain-containing protein [Ilumatobacteraceae bacterium]|nr:DUF4202 domain-containing protein [Ilumatobacteraceae bacterium]